MSVDIQTVRVMAESIPGERTRSLILSLCAEIHALRSQREQDLAALDTPGGLKGVISDAAAEELDSAKEQVVTLKRELDQVRAEVAELKQEKRRLNSLLGVP